MSGKIENIARFCDECKRVVRFKKETNYPNLMASMAWRKVKYLDGTFLSPRYPRVKIVGCHECGKTWLPFQAEYLLKKARP